MEENTQLYGNAREAALRALMQVDQEGAYAQIAANAVLKARRISPEDARLMTEIVYGVTRMRAALDYIIDKLVKDPAKLELTVRQILRIGIYQLLYLEKIPDSAAVNESVKMAKKYANPGAASLVNAVLRNTLRKGGLAMLPAADDEEDYLAVTLSHPRWLVKRLLKEYGFEAAEAFCRFDNRRPEVCLRVDTRRTSREELRGLLRWQGITGRAGELAPEALYVSGGSPEQMAEFAEGLCTVQGEASMLASRALAPQPGDLVLDMCAAPGGKTTHLAQLMNDEGQIYAFDIHPHKVELIRENAKRMQLGCITAEVADAATLPARFAGKADCVLLDAPCSGLGVLASRSDARWRKKRTDIAILAKLSYQLLLAACDCLKPGGRLVYSTCTVAHEENGDNIEKLLAERPDMELLPTDICPEGTRQLLPHLDGVEGFYIASLRKKA